MEENHWMEATSRDAIRRRSSEICRSSRIYYPVSFVCWRWPSARSASESLHFSHCGRAWQRFTLHWVSGCASLEKDSSRLFWLCEAHERRTPEKKKQKNKKLLPKNRAQLQKLPPWFMPLRFMHWHGALYSERPQDGKTHCFFAKSLIETKGERRAALKSQQALGVN